VKLETLFKFSYGLYIISSRKGEKFNGQITNTVFQITAEPPTIAVSINKQNLTHEYIEESNVFTVSILSKETPLNFIGLFGFKSGRDVDKFANINYKIGKTATPIVIENSIGYVEAEVINRLDVATHTLFIGRIVDAEILKEGEPMTYAYYHDVKRGTTPKTALIYIEKGETKKEVKKMEKYRCTICGYIYDPEKGDPDSGIKPGTPFEKLPDEWVCPVCGAGKDAFERET
jgi:flavin reductase (DIM6/NTAB) family NADH-FMN oxidoreductase RutF/rubredoxin